MEWGRAQSSVLSQREVRSMVFIDVGSCDSRYCPKEKSDPICRVVRSLQYYPREKSDPRMGVKRSLQYCPKEKADPALLKLGCWFVGDGGCSSARGLES